MQGQALIEELSVGDDVRVLDGGTQEIRWIGSHKVNTAVLAANPKLYPVRIRAGALGSGLPEQDLLVSPQHRVSCAFRHCAKRMFGTQEVLIPAKKLLGLDGIELADDVQEVECYHIFFDAHQVTFSNGGPTESLFTGVEALKSVSPEARAEIETLFPQICAPDFKAQPARFIPDKGKLMKRPVERHQKNRMPLHSIARAAASAGEARIGM
ncbi:MAG: Hint domain-containing protein [Paracoccus sp. (in: a-proteobacteria)]